MKRAGQASGQNERNLSGREPVIMRGDDGFQEIQQVDQLIEQAKF